MLVARNNFGDSLRSRKVSQIELERKKGKWGKWSQLNLAADYGETILLIVSTPLILKIPLDGFL